jgi:hypothetical protein
MGAGNRKIGKVRPRGEKDGLTRTEAERALRRMIEAESMRRAPTVDERPRTVDEVADLLRDRLAVEGARLSYRQNCESMQGVHVSPVLAFQARSSVSCSASSASCSEPSRR